MAEIKDVTVAEYDAVTASGTVLVDCWAPWCSSCKMLGMVLGQAAAAAPATAVVAKLNIDEAKELAVKLGVTSLPTLILYKDGAIVEKSTGVLPKGKLIELLSR